MTTDRWARAVLGIARAVADRTKGGDLAIAIHVVVDGLAQGEVTMVEMPDGIMFRPRAVH